MSRHPARDRVDRVRDLDALRLEQVGELADVVLRLRDCEPVAGDEDDLVRVREHHGDVLGARAAHLLPAVAGGDGRRLRR